jgi:cytoskeleton protein RodZ
VKHHPTDVVLLMSEPANTPENPIDTIVSLDVPRGAGAMLRSAREAQGMHIAMLAVSLKVPIKKLEALEADRYESFPDTFFIRALASSVCRTLKIDPTSILSALPRSDTPKIKTDEAGLNARFNDVSDISSRAFLAHLKRPLGIAVLALLVGIFAIVFSPKEAPLEAMPAGVSGGNTQVFPATGGDPGQAILAEQSALTASQPGDSTAASLPETSSSMTPGSTGPISLPDASAPTPSVSSELAVIGNIGTVLTLHAHGASWVEVTDGKGLMQLRQTLKEGDVIPLAGALPLSVVLGRADLVSVVVRGQAFDTKGVTNNNVARFEVK